MKKKLISAFAAAMALLMLLPLLPHSALPVRAETVYDVPEGYNAHDYQKLVAFQEQTDDDGVKNGTKLNAEYDPRDPETWGSVSSFDWKVVGGENRIESIFFFWDELVGTADFSGCTALSSLFCGLNSLTEIDVSGCTALESLTCHCNYGNRSIDVSGCAALEYLTCRNNDLTELDLSDCHALTELDCENNELTELDLSCCPELADLCCSGNLLTELDLSANPHIPVNTLRAEGPGSIGYTYHRDQPCASDPPGYVPPQIDTLYAKKSSSASEFDGWFNGDGELVSGDTEFDRSGSSETELVARFHKKTPQQLGDVNNDGSITVYDAILALRCAMGIIELTSWEYYYADYLNDGEVTILDAVMILRKAMGII